MNAGLSTATSPSACDGLWWPSTRRAGPARPTRNAVRYVDRVDVAFRQFSTTLWPGAGMGCSTNVISNRSRTIGRLLLWRRLMGPSCWTRASRAKDYTSMPNASVAKPAGSRFGGDQQQQNRRDRVKPAEGEPALHAHRNATASRNCAIERARAGLPYQAPPSPLGRDSYFVVVFTAADATNEWSSFPELFPAWRGKSAEIPDSLLERPEATTAIARPMEHRSASAKTSSMQCNAISRAGYITYCDA